MAMDDHHPTKGNEMDQETVDYRRHELTKIAHGNDRKIKITTWNGETKWISITRDELNKIILALMGDAS